MHRTRLSPLAGAVALAALLLGACSDESASEQVCDDRSELSDQMNEVADQVAEGNLGEAQDELSGVEEEFRDLQSSLDDLSAEQREELAPEVDELEAQVSDLSNAESMDDLSTGAGDVVASVESILGQVGDALSC